MCGIVGHISMKALVSLSEVEEACKLLKHRGPDGSGSNLIQKNIAFGHTRLSFLDLGENGSQPMSNANKTIWITFNGEIYNFLELKEELKNSYHFESSSDTEVLIAAYETWGIAMLSKLQGMFAFALMDRNKDMLYLVRDPFGIKPLYYHLHNNELLFASELKAFGPFEAFKKDLDYSSFCDFFVYRYVPSPKTIWQNTYKVPPAHYLEIKTKSFEINEHEYWKPTFDNKSSSETELIAWIDSHLEKSIMNHARADVPIGSFLSGGYDSSAIVYYLKKNGLNPASFSIGFDNWEKSEDYFAEKVAQHLQIPNTKTMVNESSLSAMEKMPQIYDEPIADISIIPTYWVSKLAREQVKAVMSGEGADELFGGYHWQKTFYAKLHPEGFLDKIKNLISPIDTIEFYAEAMSMGAFDEVELKKLLHPRLHAFIPKDVHWFYKKHLQNALSPLKKIQYLDMKCFMGELVLSKVDRASMANSLEVRVPFLDTAFFETIFSSKEDVYFKKDKTKFLLQENIKAHLPMEILNREKQGFVGPDSYYMNKAWYEKAFENSVLVEKQIINRNYIDDLLEKDYDWRIWKILVMEKWFAAWMA
jgi:asparagine synthase (glutamine-hydrolysing)